MGGPLASDSAREDQELDALLVHDLRSPVAAITANLSFLKAGLAADPTSLEAIRDAEVATLLLQQIIENMSLLATLVPGVAAPGAGPIDLVEATRQCLFRLRPAADSAEVAITSESSTSRSPVWIQAPEPLVRAILDNLVHTALRHTPRRRRAVTVEVQRSGSSAHLEVTDAGGPLGAEPAEAFTRAGQLAAKKDPGARYGRGLGLRVVGLAAEATGGVAEIRPHDDGALFRVSWPIVE